MKRECLPSRGSCREEGTEVGKVLDVSWNRECWVGHLESRVGRVSVGPMASENKEVEFHSVISEVLFSQHRAKSALCLGKINLAENL